MTTSPSDPTPVPLVEVERILGRVAEVQRETARLLRETDQVLRRNAEQADPRFHETEEVLRESAEVTARQRQETEWQARNAARQRRKAERHRRRMEELLPSPREEFVESLHDDDLVVLLRERGMDAYLVSAAFRCGVGPEQREADLFAMTETEAVAVTVKTTLRAEDVDDLLDLLADLPTLTRSVEGRRLYGAVACLEEQREAARHAERKGLFVIRATDGGARIANQPEFQPRDFHPPTG